MTSTNNPDVMNDQRDMNRGAARREMRRAVEEMAERGATLIREAAGSATHSAAGGSTPPDADPREGQESPTSQRGSQRAKSPRVAWYEMDDDSLCGPRVYGVVRCPEGDLETFARLAGRLLESEGFEPGEVNIAEPQWRWFRMNPDWSREYAWLLTSVDGPGRGNWMGAKVVDAS